MYYSRDLGITWTENGSTVGAYFTNYNAQSTVLVVGDTFFFYSFRRNYTGALISVGLPRLSSLVFSRYQAGVNVGKLVQERLVGFDVLGYSGGYYWFADWSPIYPSGRDAVTISIEDSSSGNR